MPTGDPIEFNSSPAVPLYPVLNPSEKSPTGMAAPTARSSDTGLADCAESWELKSVAPATRSPVQICFTTICSCLGRDPVLRGWLELLSRSRTTTPQAGEPLHNLCLQP